MLRAGILMAVWAEEAAASWFLVTTDAPSQALLVDPVSGLPSVPWSASTSAALPVLVPGRADCLFFTQPVDASWSLHCWAGELTFEQKLGFPGLPGYSSYTTPGVVDVGQDGVPDLIVLAMAADTGLSDTIVFSTRSGWVDLAWNVQLGCESSSVPFVALTDTAESEPCVFVQG